MLAVRLSVTMGKSLRWVLRRTPAEWAVYLAYYSLEPFGPRQDDFRASVVARSMSGATASDLHAVFPSLVPSPARGRTNGSEAFRHYALSRCPAMTAMR